MGYKNIASIGFSWMGFFRIITRLISLVKIAILARLLTPVEFGIFGVATLVLTFFETLSQTGLSVILVQEKDKMLKYLDSAFLISIVRGLVMGFFILIAAPFAASYFNSPDSVNLIKLIGVVALIRGFINPARVIFLKELEFAKEFWFGLVVFFVDTVVSVGLVIILHSPIGMIWGLVAGALTETVLSYLLIYQKPFLKFRDLKIIEIMKRGKWITGSNIFSYFVDQGGDIFTGRLLSTYSLGIYQAAYRLSVLPLLEVVKLINQITFPIYSHISEEPRRLKKAFTRTLLSILGLIIPMGLLMYLFSDQIILVLLGEKWAEAAVILKILTVYGICRAFAISVNPLFNALKRQDIIAKISFLSLVMLLLTALPFIRNFGLAGVAFATTTSSVVTLPLVYYYLWRVFK